MQLEIRICFYECVSECVSMNVFLRMGFQFLLVLLTPHSGFLLKLRTADKNEGEYVYVKYRGKWELTRYSLVLPRLLLLGNIKPDRSHLGNVRACNNL